MSKSKLERSHNHVLSHVTKDQAMGRDIRVNTFNVVCPDCNADIGEACVSAAGVPYQSGSHRSRRRMAVRLRNEMLDQMNTVQLPPDSPL